jgi:predicted nucleic acid-binding protein
VTALNRYEFRNAVRFAAFRKVISRADASSSLTAFEADLNAGYLQFTACDLVSVINEADRLSGLHTMKRGHRSFDILHVATARLLKARNFLTFDVNQRKLAAAAQLTVRP